MMKRLCEVLVLAAVLGIATASITKDLWAQVIRGEVTPGNYVNYKTDSSGNMYTSPGTGVSYSQAAITVTTASQQFLAANTARKYLQVQNTGAAGNITIGFGMSAISTSTSLVPGASYTMYPAPTGTVQFSATANTTAAVIEGQ